MLQEYLVSWEPEDTVGISKSDEYNSFEKEVMNPNMG